MLEKMKAKVEEDESLAQSYGELASAETSVDDEINAVLAGSQLTPASDKLAALKAKMGM
jgi:phage shock protein A